MSRSENAPACTNMWDGTAEGDTDGSPSADAAEGGATVTGSAVGTGGAAATMGSSYGVATARTSTRAVPLRTMSSCVAAA